MSYTSDEGGFGNSFQNTSRNVHSLTGQDWQLARYGRLQGNTTGSNNLKDQPKGLVGAPEGDQVPTRQDRPETRDEIRRKQNTAKEIVLAMEASASANDLLDLSNNGVLLEDVLAILWQNREIQSQNWKDLLNVLQVILGQEEFEKFTKDKCIAVRKVVSDHLCIERVEEEDIERSIELLVEAGFDPWRAVSEPSSKREHKGDDPGVR